MHKRCDWWQTSILSFDLWASLHKLKQTFIYLIITQCKRPLRNMFFKGGCMGLIKTWLICSRNSTTFVHWQCLVLQLSSNSVNLCVTHGYWRSYCHHSVSLIKADNIFTSFSTGAHWMVVGLHGIISSSLWQKYNYRLSRHAGSCSSATSEATTALETGVLSAL